MDAPLFTPRESEVFATLLDDQAAPVRAALLARFAARPEASLALLSSLAEGKDRTLAWHARWFLAELHLDDPAAEFRTFIQSLHYELETGALLLARAADPTLDLVAATTELDRLAARCRDLISEPATARERCRILNRVLFHETGLRGNTEHYEDPLNSLLPVVLTRRKGIPVSLATLYLLVARRLGLELEPVGLPGHFLVGCFCDDQPFYIDAFEGGTLRTPGEVLLFLRARGHEPTPLDLAPTPIREVLARSCRNLVAHYAAAGDLARSRLFESFIAEFDSTYARHTA